MQRHLVLLSAQKWHNTEHYCFDLFRPPRACMDCLDFCNLGRHSGIVTMSACMQVYAACLEAPTHCTQRFAIVVRVPRSSKGEWVLRSHGCPDHVYFHNPTKVARASRMF